MVKFAIKMYAGAVATADQIASIIIPQSAQLVGVSWNHTGTVAGAIGSAQWYQLATQSTAQPGLNDSRNIIDEFVAVGMVGAGFNVGINKDTPVFGIKFAAGDKIYLHTVVWQAFTVSRLNVNLLFA